MLEISSILELSKQNLSPARDHTAWDLFIGFEDVCAFSTYFETTAAASLSILKTISALLFCQSGKLTPVLTKFQFCDSHCLVNL